MKKYISILLMLVILICACMCGCNADKSHASTRTDYSVNNGGIINIGIIAPTSGESVEVGNDIVSGVKFANSLADVVNIDSTYLINLHVYDLNDDINKTKEKMLNDKVAAIICAGTDQKRTNSVINAFKEYNTPIIFTDNFSSEVEASETSYSLSVPYSYQNSVVSAYLSSEGFVNGTVVCADDSYSTAFAKSFKSLFESAGGNVTIKNEAEFDSEDFVFIIGNDAYTKNAAEAIKSKAPDANIIISEAYNKNLFENDSLSDVCFVSKFEVDVENNHIGTDFINVYSDMNDVTESDISSAVAYGYDAYMLIYGAIAKSNPNSVGTENESDENDEFLLNVSAVNDSINNSIHYGVTDTIDFTDKGLVETKFVYLDKVENSKAAMLNRYVF